MASSVNAALPAGRIASAKDGIEIVGELGVVFPQQRDSCVVVAVGGVLAEPHRADHVCCCDRCVQGDGHEDVRLVAVLVERSGGRH